MKSYPLRLFAIPMMAMFLCVGCGDSGPVGESGALAAKAANQKVSTAILMSDDVEVSGPDFDQTPCDASMDQIGWCKAPDTVIYCKSGKWRANLCEYVSAGSECGINEHHFVDCIQ